jgi:two-component system sensor histidine kinase UhpB
VAGSRPGGTGAEEPSADDLDTREGDVALDPVLEVVDANRHHIAGLIHDDLSQILTGVTLLADGLAYQLAEADRALAEEAGRVSELGRQAVVHTRRLIQALAPSPLGHRGLKHALEQLAADTERQYDDVRCRADLDDRAEPAHRGVAGVLYRVAQEAVLAAVRHRRATRIEIALKHTADTVRLDVADDGSPWSSDPTSPSGLTARLIAARAGAIGARIELAEGEDGRVVLSCILAAEGTAEGAEAD